MGTELHVWVLSSITKSLACPFPPVVPRVRVPGPWKQWAQENGRTLAGAPQPQCWSRPGQQHHRSALPGLLGAEALLNNSACFTEMKMP